MKLELRKEVLDKISPSSEEIKEINIKLKEFISKLKRVCKEEIFIGGSFAKGTLIRKDKYDIDVFVRFNSTSEDISKKLEEKLKKFAGVQKIHGSRDYFRIDFKNFFVELIPVLKNSKKIENITDLSYSHVNYIRRIKSKKILEDIKIAKAFCYASGCYGAESYIKGFSGYALELLVYAYGGFEKMLRALVNSKDKLVIDIEKHYKNRAQILMDMNSAKLVSPIILVDPTFKQRNVLAALSEETFEKFKKNAERFLKNPSINFFESQKKDFYSISSGEGEKIILHISTLKQEGDIAGTKLLKFYNHLTSEIARYYSIIKKDFEYSGEKEALAVYVLTPKKEIIFSGPKIEDKENIKKFRKMHLKLSEKNGRVFAIEKFNEPIKKFIEKWRKKNHRKIKEMYISDLKIS